MDWVNAVELAFDESIQDLGVDMAEACDNGTYPKARDNVVDAVASIFSDEYDPRLKEAEERPDFRICNAYVNLQIIAGYMHARMTEHSVKRDKAEKENKELRELVQDMSDAFIYGNCYKWCKADKACNYITDGKCQFLDRMQELELDGYQ